MMLVSKISSILDDTNAFRDADRLTVYYAWYRDFKKGEITMNKKILLLLALSLVLVSCESYPPRDGAMFGEMGVLSVPGCAPYIGIPPICKGDENDPKVTIDLDAKTVEPMCIKAKKGKKIEFSLEPKGKIDEATVVVFPKDPKNYFWVARTNSPNKNKITVRVPKKKNKSKDPFPVGEYKYGVWTKDWCIDPRIKVEN